MKKERFLKDNEDLSEVEREWIDLFELSLKSYELIDLKHNILWLLNKLKENEVIILDANKSTKNDIQIHICKDEDIPEFLPTTLCPSFQKNIKDFSISESKKFICHINAILHTKSVVLGKWNKELKICSVFRSILVFHEFHKRDVEIVDTLKEIEAQWKIKNWFCRPVELTASISSHANFTQILSLPCTEKISKAKFIIDFCIIRLCLL